MNPVSSLRSRIAVVTGANRGIGLEIVRQLARSEAIDVVVLTSRRPEAGGEAVDRLHEAGLGKVVFHPLDVTDTDSIEALARWLESSYGGLDILINNAAVAFDGFDADIARRTLAINVRGVLDTIERLLPSMRSGGRIVNVSSGVADRDSLPERLRKRLVHVHETGTREEVVRLADEFVAEVGYDRHETAGWPSSAYRVSKLLLNALTAVLARGLERDPRHIKINAVCPGWVRTDMGGASAPRSVEKGAETPVWAALLPDDGPSGGFFRDREPADW